MFDTPRPRGDRPNVLLPLKLEHSHQVHRLIELVGGLKRGTHLFCGNDFKK
jgi:hypothetical protein